MLCRGWKCCEGGRPDDKRLQSENNFIVLGSNRAYDYCMTHVNNVRRGGSTRRQTQTNDRIGEESELAVVATDAVRTTLTEKQVTSAANSNGMPA